MGSEHPSSPTLILGAGLAGLSCAYHLRSGYRIVDKEDDVGGVARTFRRGDFYFDVTGHWLHLRDDGIRHLVDELLGDALIEVERRAEIHSHGVRTPYPFQANTHGLPSDVVADCVLGYFRAREERLRGELPPPASFEDYIRQRMGDGIAEHFMIPYNTKLWTVPPSEMAHNWCGRFVPLPEPEDVVRGALQPAGAGRRIGYNATFLYPETGGIGRLPRALRESLQHDVQLGTQVVGVDWQQRVVHFGSGERASYRYLVSTLPLTDLMAALHQVPDEVRDAAARLRATSVTYWDIGVRGPNRAGAAHWIYFPEDDVPFYRAGSASAAVPGVAPPQHRSYYVEVSHRRGSSCPASEADILAGLRRVGLLEAHEEPILMHRSTVPCAYVIMDHAYGEARRIVLDWAQAQQILSVGRYGAWTYDSMEGAMVQGRQAASQIEAWQAA